MKQIYQHGDIRDRSLLLVLYQSGFSETDVSNFRLEDLASLTENPETEHYVIEKPREKTHKTQATCLSYEAVHDIKAMLQERIQLAKDMRNRTDLSEKQKEIIQKVDPTSGGYLFISTTKNLGADLVQRVIGLSGAILLDSPPQIFPHTSQPCKTQSNLTSSFLVTTYN